MYPCAHIHGPVCMQNARVHICVSNVYRGQRVILSLPHSFSILSLRQGFLLSEFGWTGWLAHPRDPSASTQVCTRKLRFYGGAWNLNLGPLLVN